MTNYSISTVDRFSRFLDVYRLDDGTRTVQEIADELDVPHKTIANIKRYIKELLEHGISPEALNDKRVEFYLEYCEAGAEAKSLFEKYRDADANAVDIKRFLTSWIEIIDKKAKLYGLEGTRVGEININTQVNQMNSSVDQVESRVQKRIAEVMKEEHEKKLKEQEGSEDIIDVQSE